jgi:hypothetical protein
MQVALRGSYLEFVIFMGMSETYPTWFSEEMYRCSYLDESRFTIWVPKDERKADYHEKKLIEDSSVFLRKSNGDLFVVDLDLFTDLYATFRYDAFTNSGIVAFNEDCIEYVECNGGVLIDEYPDWFYEYFTEAICLPEVETIFFMDNKGHRLISNMHIENGELTVTDRCVFLRNKHGEIKGMGYSEFLKYYDPNPKIGG